MLTRAPLLWQGLDFNLDFLSIPGWLETPYCFSKASRLGFPPPPVLHIFRTWQVSQGGKWEVYWTNLSIVPFQRDPSPHNPVIHSCPSIPMRLPEALLVPLPLCSPSLPASFTGPSASCFMPRISKFPAVFSVPSSAGCLSALS